MGYGKLPHDNLPGLPWSSLPGLHKLGKPKIKLGKFVEKEATLARYSVEELQLKDSSPGREQFDWKKIARDKLL